MKYSLSIVSIITLLTLFSPGTPGAQELSHTVVKGETIYSISRLYHVSPDELMKANGISDPSKLQTGKKLTVPKSAFTGIPVPINPGTVSKPLPLTDYRVKKGDTLYGIARNNNTDITVLQEINKFSKDHVIKTGDIIKVPAREPVIIAQGSPSTPVNSGKIDTSLRWPVNALEIAYMTGQLGVIVDGVYSESVKSITAGKVVSAGPWRKFGKVVIVEVAGSYFYMYGGCESLSVKVGDKISPGTELGKLGISAASEKPQLFFMVFKSNTPIDPAIAPRAAIQITRSEGG
ncbi:MAG: M23 family metallopeptidase [Treponema sp.]|nr:M23 family metallopeptidase [Treponema sp.]